MGTESATRTEGREDIFAALPPADLKPSRWPADRGRSASWYTWNLRRRFGPDWAQKWIDLTIRRMDAWGLNTVASWSDSRLWDSQRKAYVIMLRGWGIETGYLGLPDVYSEDFVRMVGESVAQQCAPHKEDPWLLGYFIGNEPPWPGRESELVNMILDGPETATQRELKPFLGEGDTSQRRMAFVHRAFERGLEIVNGAIRKHDPNHLNLGIRFGGTPSEQIIRVGRVFDVYSMNVYRYSPDPEVLDRVYHLTGRPILIGEFHVGTPGRGLAAGLVQARHQQERGVAHRYYVENAAAMPFVIGTHWFQWIDQPPTGRMDGENYNIGFVDVTDRPYWEFLEGVRATHKRLCDVHSNTQPPVSRPIRAT